MLTVLKSSVLDIGGRNVGDGKPCFVIAEIGSNHNQDLELAFDLIDAAADSGVDAVKFQTFRASEHYSTKTPGFGYLNNINTYDLIKSLELNRAWHGELKNRAEKRGIVFFSSPCDSDAIIELSELDVAVFKVASFDITDNNLISEMAATGKPLIISTGMANWTDIQMAVSTARSVGNDQIILLQCTSLYPAPVQLSNLRSMTSMRSIFGTLTGYSDHTNGDHIAVAAVAMGACVLEKHFTLDRNMKGPDHPFAIEPHEMLKMISKIRDVEAALGDGIKNGPRAEEKEMAEKGRRSLHARVKINTGQIISENMLVVKRPGLGISPSLKHVIIGRIAKTDIEADQWITWEMI